MVYVGSSGGGKKPSKKRRSGVGGFVENLVDEVQDTATGFIPMLSHVGSAMLHDAGKTVGIKRGPYRLDNIGGDLLKGAFGEGEFWHELVWDRDLRSAGRSFYDRPLSPILDIAALFTGGAGAAVKAGKLLGKAPAARTSRVEMSPGIGFDRRLSENPVIAGRQALVDRASNRFVEAPILGARSRVARHDRKYDARRTAHENAKNLKPLREALSKVHGVKRKAVWIVAGGHNLDDLMKFYATRHRALETEIQRKKAKPSRERGDTIDVDGEVAVAAAGQIGRESAEPGTSLVLRGERAKRADMDEEMAYEEAPFEALRDADRRESVRVNQRNLARVKKRIAELEQIRQKGILDAPDADLLRAAEAANELSRLTTARLVKEGLDPELAARRASLEAQLLRTAGIRDDVYGGAIRSHISLGPDKMDVSAGRGRSKWTKPGKMDELQRNSGYNFWNAKDSTNPAMYIHSARQVFEYRARLDRVAVVMDRAQWVDAKDAARMERDGWKVVSAESALRKDIDDVYKVLVDSEEVLAGTPGYEAFARALEESLVRKGATDMVPVVPAAYYRELVGEFAKSSNFIRKWLDNPTRVWRALTLNMRPAWLVNNFVGQMLLLAVAHGAQGVKAYVEQFGRKGKIADELAPELTDFGWAHESMADLAGLGGNKITSGMRRMSDFMGRLNAKLTDDHTRKAAWVATMKPHVARYRKAHPELDWHEAARELWKNERFADEVTQRVLDDMIDFSDLSNVERRVIKRAVPFYSWIKGISKRTGRLVMDDPVKAAVGVQLGQLGIAANEEQYGTLPHFLKGIIGSPFGDENTILTTQGLNPFMTPADITAMLSGTVLPGRQDGPQNPLAQANPILKAPLEALANRDFFFGGEVDREGDMSFLQRAGKQGLNSFAQKRLIDEWFQQRKAETEGLEYDPLYEPSFRNAVLQYLGLPQRQLDVKAARKRASEDT